MQTTITSEEIVGKKAQTYKDSLNSFSGYSLPDKDLIDEFYYCTVSILDRYRAATDTGKKVLKKFSRDLSFIIDDLYWDIVRKVRLSDLEKTIHDFIPLVLVL